MRPKGGPRADGVLGGDSQGSSESYIDQGERKGDDQVEDAGEGGSGGGSGGC